MNWKSGNAIDKDVWIWNHANMIGKVVSTPFDALTYKITGCAMRYTGNSGRGSHLAQIVSYLAVSCCPGDLPINFGERSLVHRRIFPPQKVIDDLINRERLFVPDWLTSEEDHE